MDAELLHSRTLRHASLHYPLSWPHLTSPQDVREAVLAACQAIVDGPFELVDSNGHPATLSDVIRA